MAKGIPSSSATTDVAPLTVRRLKDAPLVKIGAFKVMQQKKNDKTGEEYEVEQVNLSLDFDSGHIMRDQDGNPVLTEDGQEQPHYLNEGFTTLSGNNRAKLVAILKALGMDDEPFIEQTGNNAGGLSQEAAESLEATFGVNGLGDDYAGADWDDLPFYVLPSKGGQQKKRDVEVPVTSLKILGREIIGRHLDMAITTKNGWNRVESYLISENPAPLDESKPARSMPAEKTRPTNKPIDPETADIDTPLDPEPTEVQDADPPVTTKGQKYVLAQLKEAGVPPPFYVAVAQLMSGFDDFDKLEEMSTEAAKNFRSMHQADDSNIEQALEAAMAEGGDAVPFEEDDSEDDF